MGQKYLGKIDHPKSYVNKEYVDNLLAPSEYDASHASQAYAVGDYFIYNKTLYQATAAIATNAAITPNTNCVAIADLTTLIEERVKHLSVTFATSDFMANGDNTIPANYVGSKTVSGLRSSLDYCAVLTADPASMEVVKNAKFKPFNGVQAGVLYVYCDVVPSASITFSGTFTQV